MYSAALDTVRDLKVKAFKKFNLSGDRVRRSRRHICFISVTFYFTKWKKKKQ
jgi:hypothetical protein